MTDYHYIQINNRYICLQQNPLMLFRLLYLKHKSLPLGVLGFNRLKKRNAVIALTLSKLRLRLEPKKLVLPAFGHVGVDVHRGYRLFDLKHRTATKVIAPYVSPENAAIEIEGACLAGRLSFSPKIYAHNIAELWYQEELISGKIGYPIPNASASALLSIYQSHIAAFIAEMVLLCPLNQKELRLYLDELATCLDDVRLSELPLDAEKLTKIRDFVMAVTNELRQEENRQVDLVFSHGDFSFVNVLNSKSGMRIIDWESVDRRSPLNDFYNYFFTELYYQRVESSLVSEISQALSILQGLLQPDAPKLTQDLLPSANLYRRLYYLERIKMLLGRELNDKRLHVIVRSIDIFNQFEEALGNKRY